MDINHLALDCQEWADEVFPNRTDASMFLKFYSEVGELIDAEDDCELEIGDVLILILDYARRKGVNPSLAVQKKLAINKRRQWVETSIGTMKHVK